MEDYSENIMTEDMPLCPFCDQPIMSYEPYRVIVAHDCKALAHECCVEGASDDS